MTTGAAISLSLAGDDNNAKLHQLVCSTWQETKQLPLYHVPLSQENLQELKPRSVNVFCNLVKKLQQNEKARRAKSQELILEHQQPLFPIPVIVSPLFLLLLGRDYGLVENSLELLSFYVHLESQLIKFSTKKRATIKKICEHKTQIVSQFVDFTNNTLSRFCCLMFNEPLASAFIEENFYNTMNWLRIYEFNIMELLEIPKKEHHRWAMYVEPPKWPEDPAFFSSGIPSTLQSIYKATAELLNKNYGNKPEETHDWSKKVQSAPKNFNQWMNLDIVQALFQTAKRVLSINNPFYCGNRKCKKQEDLKNQVKFMRCSRCQWVRYCSQECQVVDWKAYHKDYCSKALPKERLDEIKKGRRLVIGQDGDDEDF
eukprot:TRINITY_DN712_c0_g1_i2.p1 TRINITY_DN712_c0_g1~~TRINITY_DN712_c0_g1_i2.p1  ORF type:complete len:371 (+),score=48.35 TRINITY_DN712_c0_g1_i2:45-1157(+)